MAGFKEFDERVEAHEKHWKWKIGLRVVTCILVLATIGMVGWLVGWSTSGSYYGRQSDYYYGYGSDYFIAVFFFIPLGLSIVWNCVAIPTTLVRRRGIHPGFAVGFDLVLWMLFAVAGGIYLTYAIASSAELNDSLSDLNSASGPFTVAYGTTSYTSGSYAVSSLREGYPYPSSAPGSGQPYTYFNESDPCAPNSSSSSYSNDCPSGSYSSSGVYSASNSTGTYRTRTSPDYQCPYFPSCSEQAAVLDVAKADLVSRQKGVNVYIASAVFLLLIMLLHFVIFVWACVDTSRYRTRRQRDIEESRAKAMAMEMVRAMQNGQNQGPGFSGVQGSNQGQGHAQNREVLKNQDGLGYAPPTAGFYAPAAAHTAPAQNQSGGSQGQGMTGYYQYAAPGAGSGGYAPVSQQQQHTNEQDRAPQLGALPGIETEGSGAEKGSTSTPPGILQTGKDKGKAKSSEHVYESVPQVEEGESSTAARIQWGEGGQK